MLTGAYNGSRSSKTLFPPATVMSSSMYVPGPATQGGIATEEVYDTRLGKLGHSPSHVVEGVADLTEHQVGGD